MTNLEPYSDKMVLFAYADNKGPDQPAHLCSISRLLLSVHVFYYDIQYVYNEDFEKKKKKKKKKKISILAK